MKQTLIKAILPGNNSKSKKAPKEIIEVCIEDEVKQAIENGEAGNTYKCIFYDVSLFYKDLHIGTEVPIQLRKDTMPIIPFDWLLENIGKPNEEMFLLDVIEKD